MRPYATSVCGLKLRVHTGDSCEKYFPALIHRAILSRTSYVGTNVEWADCWYTMHTSAYASIHYACVSIRYAYVSIRQHT